MPPLRASPPKEKRHHRQAGGNAAPSAVIVKVLLAGEGIRLRSTLTIGLRWPGGQAQPLRPDDGLRAAAAWPCSPLPAFGAKWLPTPGGGGSGGGLADGLGAGKSWGIKKLGRFFLTKKGRRE